MLLITFPIIHRKNFKNHLFYQLDTARCFNVSDKSGSRKTKEILKNSKVCDFRRRGKFNWVLKKSEIVFKNMHDVFHLNAETKLHNFLFILLKIINVQIDVCTRRLK